MRTVFRDTLPHPAPTVRVGRTRDGWAAVTDDGTLLALTPARQATLDIVTRLRIRRLPGQPAPVRRALATGSPFQVKVWRACLAIPRGRTLSYGELAKRVGCGSAQAVGQALGRNPLCRLIPCHRVTSARGPGGFAWGANLKRRWLRQEAA